MAAKHLDGEDASELRARWRETHRDTLAAASAERIARSALDAAETALDASQLASDAARTSLEAADAAQTEARRASKAATNATNEARRVSTSAEGDLVRAQSGLEKARAAEREAQDRLRSDAQPRPGVAEPDAAPGERA